MDTARWPAAIAALPVCPKRKLPIPYAAERNPDGTGVFTAIDPVRKLEIAEKRLCAVCSLPPLGYWLAFLGDKHSLERGGYFIDPPMHEDCAELSAMELCPFIGIESVPRRALVPADVIIGDAATVAAIPKGDWIMAIVRSYKTHWERAKKGSVLVFTVPPPKRVRRFTYTGGRLADTGEGRR